MRNSPFTTWRKRDLAYQLLVHALAVVGIVYLTADWVGAAH